MLHLAIREHKTQLAYHIISIFTHPDYLDIRNKWSQVSLNSTVLAPFRNSIILAYTLFC